MGLFKKVALLEGSPARNNSEGDKEQQEQFKQRLPERQGITAEISARIEVYWWTLIRT